MTKTPSNQAADKSSNASGKSRSSFWRMCCCLCPGKSNNDTGLKDPLLSDAERLGARAGASASLGAPTRTHREMDMAASPGTEGFGADDGTLGRLSPAVRSMSSTEGDGEGVAVGTYVPSATGVLGNWTGAHQGLLSEHLSTSYQTFVQVGSYTGAAFAPVNAGAPVQTGFSIPGNRASPSSSAE